MLSISFFTLLNSSRVDFMDFSFSVTWISLPSLTQGRLYPGWMDGDKTSILSVIMRCAFHMNLRMWCNGESIEMEFTTNSINTRFYEGIILSRWIKLLRALKCSEAWTKADNSEGYWCWQMVSLFDFIIFAIYWQIRILVQIASASISGRTWIFLLFISVLIILRKLRNAIIKIRWTSHLWTQFNVFGFEKQFYLRNKRTLLQ